MQQSISRIGRFVSLCGVLDAPGGSDFDTVLAIYTGNSLSNLASVASNDNAPDATTSEVYVELQSGETYYIAVDGHAGAAGLAQLNLAFIPDTVGDNEIPFLPPWALLMLGAALFGLKGGLERNAAKIVVVSAFLLSPLVVNYPGTAYANPVPQPVGTVSNWYYIHGDHLDTPQLITDASQSVVWEAHYTPFGQATVVNQQIENNLRFPGQYFDQESGLHYNYFRDYDPGLGRYVQSDPIGLAGGLNTYGYVGGNPIGSSDPLGLTRLVYYPGSGNLYVYPEREGASPYPMPGSSGRPNCGCDETTRDQGPIPSGSYSLSSGEITNPGPIGDILRNTRGDWGDWRAPLHPGPTTNTYGRSGFFLHGGSFPGSAGCIDIGGGTFGNSQTDQLLNDLLSDPDGILLWTYSTLIRL